MEWQANFQNLKDALYWDTVLVHYDPYQEIGISCDASNNGIGTELFYRHQDGGDQPICLCLRFCIRLFLLPCLRLQNFTTIHVKQNKIFFRMIKELVRVIHQII